MNPIAAWALLSGCGPVTPDSTDLPTPLQPTLRPPPTHPVDALYTGWIEDLARGQACEVTQAGTIGGVTLMNPAVSTRLQVQLGGPIAVVFRGFDLDAPFVGDDDVCDDLLFGNPADQEIHMAWSLTEGEITYTEDLVGFRIQLVDATFTPDAAFAQVPEFSGAQFTEQDVAAADSFTVGTVDLGLIPFSGVLIDLE